MKESNLLPSFVRAMYSRYTNRAYLLVRVKGIEPLSQGWQPSILPFNDTRIFYFGAGEGNRTPINRVEADYNCPLYDTRIFFNVAPS